jgi:hypothetical protein
MTRLLTCPHCRFSVRPSAAFLMIDYCPRCLAKRHVAERLRQPGESAEGTTPAVRRRKGGGRNPVSWTREHAG